MSFTGFCVDRWIGASGRLRVLGPDHPYTLTNRANLAYWRERGSPGGDVRAGCVS